MVDLRDITQWYDFRGKTVVVTGGTGVLGKEMVWALVGCNADVAIIARDVQKAEAVVQAAQETVGGGRAAVFQADVLDRASLEQAGRSIQAEFGRIDGLINGAGGNRPQATTNPQQSFFDLPEDALRFVFDLNLLGAILPSQVFGRIMAEQRAGVILNISSMTAIAPLTRVAAYSAAKAGVSNFTQWLAVHMAQEYSPNIRVNAIAPGFFLGEQNRFLLIDRETGDLTPRGQSIISHTPMARFGDPADLIGAVLWLLSPASAFVTGVVVPIDGGFSAFGGV